MNSFNYTSDDPNVHGVVQANLVLELQQWLQGRPDAVTASNAYLATWSAADQKTLTVTLIGMDTVLQMAQYMDTYKGPAGNNPPPFICGSTPVLNAAHINFPG
jgi:hypothetical protein